MEQFDNKPKIQQSYGVLVLTWLGLIILTGFSIAITGINFGNMTVIAAVAVSVIQSALILRIFIKQKSGDLIFRVFAVLSIVIILLLLILL